MKSAMWGRAVDAVAEFQQQRASWDGMQHSSRFVMRESVSHLLSQEHVARCRQVIACASEHTIACMCRLAFHAIRAQMAAAFCCAAIANAACMTDRDTSRAVLLVLLHCVVIIACGGIIFVCQIWNGTLFLSGKLAGEQEAKVSTGRSAACMRWAGWHAVKVATSACALEVLTRSSWPAGGRAWGKRLAGRGAAGPARRPGRSGRHLRR